MIIIIIITKTFFEKIKCDVRMMIDYDVVGKKSENRAGMSSY